MLIIVPAIIVLLLPFSIVQRYRAGTARRPGRGWVAAFNTWSLAGSTAIFMIFSAISSTWLPGAFTYSVAGLAVGCALGFAGLALTFWEAGASTLHYTPNRWLVLALSAAIATKIGFGLWRAWHAWTTTPDVQSWLAHSGLAGSMAVGAVVVGYYFIYWAGVWKRIRQHRIAIQPTSTRERRVRSL